MHGNIAFTADVKNEVSTVEYRSSKRIRLRNYCHIDLIIKILIHVLTISTNPALIVDCVSKYLIFNS